jgi:hypothetical protein
MAKGQKTGGRQAGTPNKVTTAFKDAVRIVYEDIGGHAAFAAWARECPTEFYRIASRLIPTEIAPRDHEIGITVVLAACDSAGRVIECEPHVRHLGYTEH